MLFVIQTTNLIISVLNALFLFWTLHQILLLSLLLPLPKVLFFPRQTGFLKMNTAGFQTFVAIYTELVTEWVVIVHAGNFAYLISRYNRFF